MNGDPTNVATWGDADIYVSFDLEAATPADEDTPFSGDWEPIGILNGEAGIQEESSYTATPITGWGWGTVATGYSDFGDTWKFTAIEDNDIVWRLRHPNSTAPNISANHTPERVLLAYEIRNGDTIKRKICTGFATVVPDGAITIQEKGAAQTAFVASFYADDSQNVFVEQPADVGAPGS